jgi:phytoene dehydrogenase-like protein
MTDAVVIGAGVNGLTAANYLARGGMKVLVLEARAVVGGIASTYEFAPGFRASIGPENCGLLLPQVVSDLELGRHGLELLTPDEISFAPAREGAGLLLWRDSGRSAEEIGKLSRRDAEAYPRFATLVEKIASFLKLVLAKPAPMPRIESGSDLMELLKLGWGFKQLGTRSMHEALRALPMAIQDFLDEWFENDLLKAALGAQALEGVSLGPRSGGTSALFLYHQLGNRKLARGGAGAVARALAKALESQGGALRTGARVKKILVEDGRAAGVALESGEEIQSSVVLSTLAPRTTFHGISEPSHLPPSYVSEIDSIRYRGVTAKLNLALSALPELRSRPGKEPGAHHRAVIRVGESLDELERAYDDSKYGRFSERPALSVTIPSLADPGAAPQGKHVMSVVAQSAPYRLRGTTWSESKDAFTARILDRLSEVAPDVKSLVLHSHLWTPEDYERELGLPEGNWHQGEMALDQMFFLRPVPGWARYETPIERLYLGGSSTHPGGGITGACGYLAASRILKDSS